MNGFALDEECGDTARRRGRHIESTRPESVGCGEFTTSSRMQSIAERYLRGDRLKGSGWTTPTLNKIEYCPGTSYYETYKYQMTLVAWRRRIRAHAAKIERERRG